VSKFADNCFVIKLETTKVSEVYSQTSELHNNNNNNNNLFITGVLHKLPNGQLQVKH
jgi:hypothetical protein